MPKVRLPYPIDLMRAYIATLRIQGVFDTDDIRGIVAEHRVYDRTTGNFKAMVWYCTVSVNRSQDASSVPLGPIRTDYVNIVVLDKDIDEFQQATIL